MTEEIDKAASKVAVGRNLTEKGQPRIVTSSRFIQDNRKKDLVMPNRLCTFDNMAQDDAVFNSIDVTNLPVLLAMSEGQFVSKSGSRASKIATDFLNYAVRNMSCGTWMESMQNATTDLQYGFSLQNIVTEVAKNGPYKGSRVIKKLAPRDQKSVYSWVWDKNLRELKGFVQKPMLIQNREPNEKDFRNGLTTGQIANGQFKKGYPFIKSEQALHFRHNPTNNNPQGDPPLLHCYDAWMEKKLVERLTLAA